MPLVRAVAMMWHNIARPTPLRRMDLLGGRRRTTEKVMLKCKKCSRARLNLNERDPGGQAEVPGVDRPLVLRRSVCAHSRAVCPAGAGAFCAGADGVDPPCPVV